MEINPRIPGSIRASESVLGLNLLDLHVKSFTPDGWLAVKNLLRGAVPKGFSTKLIYFAPRDIDKDLIREINDLEFVHDKSEPIEGMQKGAPVCTILYHGKDFSESYFSALRIANNISKIVQNKKKELVEK